MTGQSEPEGAKAARVDLGSFPQAGVAVVFGASGGIGKASVEAIKAANPRPSPAKGDVPASADHLLDAMAKP